MSVICNSNRRLWLMAMVIGLITLVSLPRPAEAASWRKVARKSDKHLNAGKRLFRAKKFSQAEREFTRALYYTRKVEKKCTGLIRSCKMTNRKGFYRRYSNIYMLRGGSFYFRGKYNSALKDFKASLEKDYSNDFARYYLGKTHYRLGNKRTARKQYRILKRDKSKYAVRLYRFMKR